MTQAALATVYKSHNEQIPSVGLAKKIFQQNFFARRGNQTKKILCRQQLTHTDVIFTSVILYTKYLQNMTPCEMLD